MKNLVRVSGPTCVRASSFFCSDPSSCSTGPQEPEGIKATVASTARRRLGTSEFFTSVGGHRNRLPQNLEFCSRLQCFEGFSMFQQIASKVLFRVQNSSKTSPKRFQNASKSLPRGPQDTTTTLPRGSKGVPRTLKMLPRAQKMTKISHSEPLRVSSRLPRVPEVPKTSQKPPKSPTAASQDYQKTSQRAPRLLPADLPSKYSQRVEHHRTHSQPS